ncbi:MAG TPA: hypothetical protein VKV18_06165 [Chthonomonas sp.]|uniref:hypothetical protein n=1 Tax=Chthonomonas sp. TaxID=2282153 RepID=UPI002B4AFC49|nr:hypothetical protein [Chthonomonas sp.]HLI48261.1 hypothetical protein [Chthonomonas sp.]
MSGSKKLLSRFGMAGFYVLLGVLIGAFGVTMRSASSQPQEGSVTMPNLRTPSLTIVDSQGRPVITMGSIRQGEESTPALQLSSWEGNKKIFNGFLMGQNSALNRLSQQMATQIGHKMKPLIPFTPVVTLMYQPPGKEPSFISMGFDNSGGSGAVVPMISLLNSEGIEGYIRLEGQRLISKSEAVHLSQQELEGAQTTLQALLEQFQQSSSAPPASSTDSK